MTKTDDVSFNDVAASVADIARLVETQTLSRSSFHLSACVGCGVPAFQQPCSLCGYYPMEETKPAKPRPFADFAEMIERSGPDHRNGTIATWHIRSRFDSVYWAERPQAARVAAEMECVAEAAALDVADPLTVWNVICEDGRVVGRERLPEAVTLGWVGLGEIQNQNQYLDHAGSLAPGFEQEVEKVMQDWVTAAHDNDSDAIRSTLEAGRAITTRMSHVKKTGNLVYAMSFIDRALGAVPAPSLHP